MSEEWGNLPWIGVSFDHQSEFVDPDDRGIAHSFTHKVTGISIAEVEADQVLVRLPQINSLKTFRVVDGQLSNRGVQELCRFELIEVDINSGDASVTDEGLLALAKIKTLRTLKLFGGDWTDRGIAEFKRLRPDVKVTRSREGDGERMHYSQ